MKKILLLCLLLISTGESFSQTAFQGIARHRRIFFEGNSLSNYSAEPLFLYGHYIPQTVYDNCRTAHYKLAYTSYAISGRTQTLINASLPTNIAPYAKNNDIILIWEGTNDMGVNGLSGAAAFANVVTYLNTVSSYGVHVIICTVIARDMSGDAADLMTRIGDYNTLVRNNAGTYGYTVCDLAADTHFDARADASDLTYYNADKIHQALAGQNLVITMMSTTVAAVITAYPAAETYFIPFKSNDPDSWDAVFIILIGGMVYYVTRKKQPEYRMAA